MQILLQREVRHPGNREWAKGREARGCAGCLVRLTVLLAADPWPAHHPGSVYPRRGSLSRLVLP